MGNAASDFKAFGQKVSDGFNVMGKKMGEGWEATKNFGNKAWNAIKDVPVLGKIAEGVEKYTPIGLATTASLRGLDAGVGSASKLLQGDVKGAVTTASTFAREQLNQKNPLLEMAKGVPVLGKIASGVETAVNNVPIYGGMSINTMRSIGNAGLNAVDAFKEGDVKGGFRNIARGGAAYLGSRGGNLGRAGMLAQRVL